MKTRLLIIICLVGALLVPVDSIRGLPGFLDCTYDSDFIISTNKLEFVPDETFVLNVKTAQNDDVFEIVVIDPKEKEVFADVVDADKNDYAQTRFHIPDNAQRGTWSIFVTANPSHQQEVVFIGVDETPQSTLSIKPSSVHHKYKVDDASFLLAGKPDTDIQVNVLDHNDDIMHIYIVTIPLEGKCNFTLDLDEYKPGVYAVEVTDHIDDATAVFTVGLQPSTTPISIRTPQHSYYAGDAVLIIGDAPPDVDVDIDVYDPTNDLFAQLSLLAHNGKMSTSFHLPEDAKTGTWKIKARSGVNFDTLEFNVTQNLQNNAHNRTPGGSVSPDKTVYPTPWEDRSPLQQFKDGIDPKIIHCNNDLVLIQKYDGKPACVKAESVPVLTERGWIKPDKDGITVNFSFCGADGSDSKGNLNKSNSTHIWDENECEWTISDEITNILSSKYDVVIEGIIQWCIGHKGYPIRYQCDIQVDSYVKFDGQRTGQFTALAYNATLVSEWNTKSVFGIKYHPDANYYEIAETGFLRK